MPKWIKTGVKGSLSGEELEVRVDSLNNEVGIIDRNREIAIYWYKKDTEKIIKKLKEVIK